MVAQSRDPASVRCLLTDAGAPKHWLGLSGRPENYCLAGEHGGCLFVRKSPRHYELLAFLAPAGRGEWGKTFIPEALHWMFANTDAAVLFAQVKDGSAPARRFEYTPARAVWHGNRVIYTRADWERGD
jgi:hypothetical protein